MDKAVPRPKPVTRVFLSTKIGRETINFRELATTFCIGALLFVPNSLLMLYSALISRGIGVSRDHK